MVVKSVDQGGLMVILKRTGSALVLGAVTVAVIGLTAGPAAAATTWTVRPGGPIMAKSGTTTLTDTKTGATLSCASSAATGSLKKGSGLSGAGIGKVTSLTFTNCAAGGVMFKVTASHFPWHLNAVSFNATTGVTTGTITGIHAMVSSTVRCSAVIDGTSATANNGKVKVTYTNSTGKLTVLTTGGNLHLYKVTSGCGGVIHSRDPATFSASYAVSPKQTITSP